ncbi:MAG: VWA domain-containing protein, partial [Endozoicomonas sp.]
MPNYHTASDKNFGFGRQLNFAGRNALQTVMEGQFHTIAIHAERWKQFCAWTECQGIKEAHQVNEHTLTHYADYLRARLAGQGKPLSVSPQNRLSTCNVVLKALRGNDDIRIKPAEAPFLKQILECTEEDWPEDLFQSVAKEMEDWSGQQGGGLSAVTTTPQVDEVVITKEGREAGKKLLWKVQSESARLAAQLTGLVQAKTLTRDRIGRRGARLDGRRLHRVALDDGRLFKRRSESISTDAAIHISLDISSSMSPRMELAREAVLALVSALKRINGVKVSASAYPGPCEDRVYPIILNDRSALDTAMTLSGLDSYDSTPMATGLWHAVHQVLERNASRRLILMVTDGGPDIDHHRPVVDLVRRCGQSGIDVVGLGISVQTVE